MENDGAWMGKTGQCVRTFRVSVYTLMYTEHDQRQPPVFCPQFGRQHVTMASRGITEELEEFADNGCVLDSFTTSPSF